MKDSKLTRFFKSLSLFSTHVTGTGFFQQERDVVLGGDHQRIRDCRSAEAQELGVAARGVLDEAVIGLTAFQRAVHEDAVERTLEQVFIHFQKSHVTSGRHT